MKILLLTDFHFKSTKSEQVPQNQIVEELIRVAHQNGLQPDYLFFAGDLVFSGDKPEDFDLAKQCLLDPLLRAFKLTDEQLFICPGNHDVAREKVSNSIIKNITSFNTNEELDRFCKNKDLDYKNSQLPLANYREFVQNRLAYQEGENIYTDFYTVHVRQVGERRVGVVCLNTAWRAVGPDDDHNLVVPTDAVQEACALVEKCDVKLLLQHHPSGDLKGYNRRQFEDITHNQFNVSFSGHFHEEVKHVYLTNNNGIVKIEGAAIYAPRDGSQRGFTYVDIHPTEWLAICTSYYYDPQTRMFYQGKQQSMDIPVDAHKSEQNRFRKKLLDKYEQEEDKANDLFLNGRSQTGSESFTRLWTPPVLSNRHADQNKDEVELTQFDVRTLLKHDQVYLLLGKDKCGKTSLLTKLLLDSLDNFSTHDVVPMLVNFKSTHPVLDNWQELPRAMAQYYSINRAAADNLLSSKKVLLLIDNFRTDEDKHLNALSNLLGAYPQLNALVCADETLSSRVREFSFDDRKVQKIYFRSLKSKQIRELAEKVYGAKSEAQLEIVKRIKSIFNTLNIPYNFWNVSLFMYVFKDGSGNISNDVELVDLYIESILERKELVLRKASFGYEDYKVYLANLAKFLYANEAQSYSATYREVIDFTDEYLQKNPRNNIDSKAVWEYLEDRGILKSCGDKRYTFRLNAIFEYFMSVYLKHDETFRKEVIADGRRYLAFANEFEMYAGANRRDESFLQAIYSKTQTVFAILHEEFEGLVLDKQMQAVASEITAQIDKIDLERIQELNQEQRDNIEDGLAAEQMGGFDRTAEVQVKAHLPLDHTQVDSLERALQLLGRVYKNANGIDTNRDLVFGVFDYLVDTMCKFGFKVFQDIKDSEMVTALDKEKAESILKLLTQMLPVLIESRLNDVLGTNNFEQMIINRLQELKTVGKHENQLKVFVLSFLLADINLVKHHARIAECIEYTTIGILKHCLIMKIMHYLHFAVSDVPATHQAHIKKELHSYYVSAKGKFDRPAKSEMGSVLQQINNRNIIISAQDAL